MSTTTRGAHRIIHGHRKIVYTETVLGLDCVYRKKMCVLKLYDEIKRTSAPSYLPAELSNVLRHTMQFRYTQFQQDRTRSTATPRTGRQNAVGPG